MPIPWCGFSRPRNIGTRELNRQSCQTVLGDLPPEIGKRLPLALGAALLINAVHRCLPANAAAFALRSKRYATPACRKVPKAAPVPEVTQ
jgi:hypothetical protein